jgi:mono/diheme cytochrome c family protein
VKLPRPYLSPAAFYIGIAALCLAAAACAGDGHSIVDDTLGGGPIPPTLAGLQKNIFGRICINCHFPGGPGPMPLDTAANSFASLVNVESVEIPRLNRDTPADPANSYIVYKITGTPGIVGDPMPPPPEARLSQAEIDAITQWIVDGANP